MTFQIIQAEPYCYCGWVFSWSSQVEVFNEKLTPFSQASNHPNRISSYCGWGFFWQSKVEVFNEKFVTPLPTRLQKLLYGSYMIGELGPTLYIILPKRQFGQTLVNRLNCYRGLNPFVGINPIWETLIDGVRLQGAQQEIFYIIISQWLMWQFTAIVALFTNQVKKALRQTFGQLNNISIKCLW